jgi:hypothetical protein
VDTAFVSRLGSISLAALGAGAIVLSSIFWIFNFLSVGSQAEISRALGRREMAHGTRIGSLALMLATICGAAAIWPFREGDPTGLTLIWWITGGWLAIRACFGMPRVWPAIGNSPLKRK